MSEALTPTYAPSFLTVSAAHIFWKGWTRFPT